MSQINNESIVTIGNLEVEAWLYQLYTTESAKILADFDRLALSFPSISVDCIRAAHTIGSISRTLGVTSISELGYALEEWLNYVTDDAELNRTPAVLNENEQNLFKQIVSTLATMVAEVVELQEYPQHQNDAISALNELSKNYEHVHQYRAELAELAFLDDFELEEHEDNISADIATLESGLVNDTLDVDIVMPDIGDMSFEVDNFAAPGLDMDLPMEMDFSMDDLTTLTDLSELTNIDSLSPVIDEVIIPQPRREIKLKKKYDEVETLTSDVVISNDDDVQSKEFVLDDILLKAEVFLKSDDSVQDDISEDLLPYFLEESENLYQELPDAILKYGSNPTSLEAAKDLKQILHTLKGSGAMAGLLRFRYMIHNLETALEHGIPDIDNKELPRIVQFACDEGWKTIEYYKYGTTSSNTTTLKEHKDVSKTGSYNFNLKVRAKKDKQTNNVSLRVSTTQIDDIASLLNQYGMSHRRISAKLDNSENLGKILSSALYRLEQLISEIEIQAETQMQSRIADLKNSNAKFDPLELDRFSRLQELTRMIAETMHDLDEGQRQLVTTLDDSHDELRRSTALLEDAQHQVVRLRNIDVSSYNGRIERLISAACAEAKKKARFELVENTFVDSGIMGAIMPPMEHILRNSIAHGIESESKRISLGKDPVGVVKLHVKNIGSEIQFILSDDGGGINKKAVQKKALESGLIKEGHELSQEEANEMIFASGFSTAENVSQLSGRGVGMDVVKAEVLKMGGRLKVESTEGQGSTFTLTIPSFMAVTTIAPVVAKDVVYGIPANIIEDVLVVQHHDIIEAMNSRQLVYKDDFIPFVTLCDIVHTKETAHFYRNNRVVIVVEGARKIAVHVDSMLNDLNLVIRPLCQSMSTIAGLVGATVSGDGTPILIINPLNMELLERQSSLTRSHTTLATVSKKITVMVVDDSITIRKITEKFLLRENFNVVLAKDGMDAVEKLQTVTPDIFLLDIEMPRMNGFELAEHIRATPATKNIPIIMISSRAIEKYEEHAFDLGVNKYLGKPYQEHELLYNIKLFLGLEVEEIE